MRRVWILVAAGVALAGCNSHAGQPVSLPDPIASPTSAPAASPSASAVAMNLVLTADVRASLLAAGAESHNLSAADYTGLAPGMSYFAQDGSTQWAGAALIPSPASMQAQVSVQDDGAYLLFRRPVGGTWTVWDVGLSGSPEGGKCPVVVAPEVLAVWHWGPGTCRAPDQ